jgi:hypothetical protein
MSETSEKNAFLTTRSNLQVMGLSDESEWKVRVCKRFKTIHSTHANLQITGKIKTRRRTKKAIGRNPVAVATENVKVQR